MKTLFVICLASTALAGCATPSPKFAGELKNTVDVNHRTFHVYASRTSAQAIRVNREWNAPAGEVFADAATAIERVTGCQVNRDTLSGDVAVVSAAILCNQ